MRMVLGEAVCLSLASAVVGAIVAVATTYILTFVPKVNGFIEGGIAVRIILEGVGITFLIGLLGGAYPAYRAACLLPTEAIRHE
jgi:putative ABC transport system permease protein